MSEILTIPAGVIMPKDLIMWLVKRRDVAMDEWRQAVDNDDFDEANLLCERALTYGEVLLYVQHGPGK
jgi:hypothetical protein